MPASTSLRSRPLTPTPSPASPVSPEVRVESSVDEAKAGRRPCDQVRVRVPATSANLGPGFDAFGLALTLYDDLVVTPGGTGVTVHVSGSGEGEVPLDETHLVVRSIRAGLEALGASVPGFTVRCEYRIS